MLGGVRQALAPLARAVVTPLLPEDYLDLIAPMRPGARRARVVAVQQEAARATTLVLRPAGRWPGHRAGQYVRLGVEVDGVRLWRSYSLTGPVRPDGTLTLTVTAVDEGRVSSHVRTRLRPGTLVGLEGPDGDFTLPDPLPEKALFVTGGSGLTPVIGILRTHLSALGGRCDVVVVHSARTAQDVLFGEELRSLHARGLLRLVEHHTATSPRLDGAALIDLVPDVAERETWACGPNGLVDTVVALFEDKGLADRLHVERFRPAVVSTGDGGTIAFARTGAVVPAPAGTTVLEAGEEGGVLLPSGCRMGICFTCVVPLTEGTVRDIRNGTLTTADPELPVLVQTCINAPAGDCSIDA